MLTAFGTCGDGSKMVLLGLTAENLRRLKSGEPIRITCSDHAVPEGLVICIAYGFSEDDLKRKLATHIGPNTKFEDRRPGRN